MKRSDAVIGMIDLNNYSFVAALQGLMKHLSPQIEWDGEKVDVRLERMHTRPYRVQDEECPYRVIVNRNIHWNSYATSYFMMFAQRVYMLNDVASFLAMNKNTTYGHMSHLGLNIPKTWALPSRSYEGLVDVPIHDLLHMDHDNFDLREIGRDVGYPAFLKPQSGGGWKGVSKVNNEHDLIKACDASGNTPLNLQEAIEFKEFVRVVGIGPQMLVMHFNPDAKYSHDRYLRSDKQAVEFNFISSDHYAETSRITRMINAFYKWDHNSCEMLIDKDGKVHPIDFANACPDSSLVSLHFYFPTLVKYMAQWLIYCAVTRRQKAAGYAVDWHRYFATGARNDLSYMERLEEYNKIAHDFFNTEHFLSFCEEHMPDFDQQAQDFFASDAFTEIIEKEVKYYFTFQHEWSQKIAHYRGIHEFYLSCERDRLRQKDSTTTVVSATHDQEAMGSEA
ncbi:MAG: hypothetical protein H6728_15260 [Myxococcales bacterium]|nr:hypothetical protein [Myxococcales bacterium]MCB9644429.1 hypothetical protein [Myxococcales bacterium]